MKIWVSFWAFISLSLILLSVCESQESKDQREVRQNAEYKVTNEGAKYYETCIEGKAFYVAWRTMAGPVGDCES